MPKRNRACFGWVISDQAELSAAALMIDLIINLKGGLTEGPKGQGHTYGVEGRERGYRGASNPVIEATRRN